MPESMKDGQQEIEVGKLLDIFTETMAECIPGALQLTVLDLCRNAILSLQAYIQTDSEISAEHPFARLDYEVHLQESEEVEEESERLLTEHLKVEDIGDWLENMAKAMPEAMEIPVMRAVTREVMIRQEETDTGDIADILYLPQDVAEEINSLPESERQAKADELAAGLDLSGLKISGTVTTPTGTEAYSAKLVFAILPLTIDAKTDRAFFPVMVGLDFTEGTFAAWAEEDRNALFNELLGAIEEIAAPFMEVAKAKGQPRLRTKKPDRVQAAYPKDFKVAAGYVPQHTLAKRDPGGELLFPEEREQFYATRTPLNWRVGLALFSCTSERDPRGWQEVTVKKLVDLVYCLTERGTLRRGDYLTDILAEVIKLHDQKNPYARYEYVKKGRYWKREIVIGSDYVIPNIQLRYRDKESGKMILASDPAFRALARPLEIKGRRAHSPDGTDILSLPGGRFKLVRIRWRWNPDFADDLKPEPAIDGKGRVMRDRKGRALLSGYNIEVSRRIFAALFQLCAEKQYVAHDLLILLAHDIYKPPPQSTDPRNVIEREAERLFDRLGLNDDPRHPGRREDMVARAIFRLKQPDIRALLPGSDEEPRPPSEAELASSRRKHLYYRLVRSPEFTPSRVLITEEEELTLQAEVLEQTPLPEPPTEKHEPKAKQVALPGLEDAVAVDIPSGAELKAALDAAKESAGISLRTFTRMVDGNSLRLLSTWSNYQNGAAIPSQKTVTPEVWQRVRDFIAEHLPEGDPDGRQGDA